MKRLQPTKSIEPQAVVIDEQLDVRARLEQLRVWKRLWEHEDYLLERRAMQLDGDNPHDVQKGAQIASLRKRLQLNLVKEPIEIAPALVEQTSYPSGVFPEVAQQLIKDEYLIYYSSDAGATVPAIFDYLKAHDDHLVDLRVERPSLEDRFLEITQPDHLDGG